MRGDGGGGGMRGLSQRVQLCTSRDMDNFGDLPPYLIYGYWLIISISSPQGRPRREPAEDEGEAGNRVGGAISEILGSSPRPSAWG
jgi:hypothetical protein